MSKVQQFTEERTQYNEVLAKYAKLVASASNGAVTG